MTKRDEVKSPCFECKDYKKCPYLGVKDWYTYGEVRFCPYQIIFIIGNSETLLKGEWPENPANSSSIDPAIKTGFKGEAYFTKPEEIVGEVEYRLKTTADAGECLVDQINKGQVTVLVEDGKIRIKGLSGPADRALMYIKGWRRKRINFFRWLRDIYYKKTVVKQQFLGT